MTLNKKMLTGYGVAFTLLGLVVVWSLIGIKSLVETSDRLIYVRYRNIHAAESMINALERQESGILQILVDDTQNGITQFRKYEAAFLKWLARAKDNTGTPKDKKLIDEIETNYAGFREQFSALTDFPDANDPETGSMLELYRNGVLPFYTKIRQNCLELVMLNENELYTAGVTAERRASYTIWSAALLSLITLTAAFFFTRWMVTQIVRPIKNLENATAKITSGDFSCEIPVRTEDELGHLSGLFNQMADQLKRNHANAMELIQVEKNKTEAILAGIEDGMIIFDTQLMIASINSVARRMLFLADADISHLKCTDILKRTPICDLLSHIIESGAPPNIPDKQRMVVISKDEQLHHYLFSINVIHAKENKLSGIVLLLRDVTRLKEVERLKNEFILAASHELRTPLTSLGMNIDLLRDQAAAHLAEEEKGYLQAAHEEVHRMKALVTDLLDLSKIESGRIALEFESVPVQTLFEYVRKVFKTQMERKSITLSGAFTDELPNIRADANKITWVLSNLISNAMRYVDNGGQIQFIANRIGPQIHLSVRDNGPGIPLNYQSKIFQKYVQVKGQESGGTGLGLAICKEIVRAHGGGIWVESLPGQGSTFTFTLPVAH